MFLRRLGSSTSLSLSLSLSRGGPYHDAPAAPLPFFPPSLAPGSRRKRGKKKKERKKEKKGIEWKKWRASRYRGAWSGEPSLPTISRCTLTRRADRVVSLCGSGIADREVAFFLAKCLVCKCNCIGDALSGAFFFLFQRILSISPSRLLSFVRENLSRNLILLIFFCLVCNCIRDSRFLELSRPREFLFLDERGLILRF